MVKESSRSGVKPQPTAEAFLAVCACRKVTGDVDFTGNNPKELHKRKKFGPSSQASHPASLSSPPLAAWLSNCYSKDAQREPLSMARTIILIFLMSVVWPVTAVADTVGAVSLGNDLLALGVVPTDESVLMPPLSTEENTIEYLLTSADSEHPNRGASLGGSGLVDLPVVMLLEPTTDDLRLIILVAVLLGGFCHFLTSPYYALLWNRLFGPLNWS